MNKVVSVEAKPGYILAITFKDGTYGEVPMECSLWGPMFEPLKDPEFFAQVGVDDYGAVCWPNGVDLCPDSLYRKVTGRWLNVSRETTLSLD